MGIQWFNTTAKMMKSIICVVLVAGVFAEAEPKSDADAYLRPAGLSGLTLANHPYGIAGSPYGYPASAYGYGATPYGYAASPYGYRYHDIGKRSADANVYSGHPSYLGYGLTGYPGYGYPLAYAGVNQAANAFHPYSDYPYHALGKRSADADADTDAYLGAYGYPSPLSYGYGYAPRGYGFSPSVYGYPHNLQRVYGYGL